MSKQTEKPLLPLTAKEKIVLEFVENCLQQHGIAPSFQEIRDHFGFASLNSVQRYLKQLQSKKYIYLPGGNQKRAITLLHSSQSIQSSLSQMPQHSNWLNYQQPKNPFFSTQQQKESPLAIAAPAETLSVPLLGRVAAGSPIEALESNEHVDVPAHLMRNPAKSYLLIVEGESMIEDGILDGDMIIVQRQEQASNGETVIALIDNEATVKRFYLHKDDKLNKFMHKNPQVNTQGITAPVVELRPANSQMKSMWFKPNQVDIQGIVVGLLRKY